MNPARQSPCCDREGAERAWVNGSWGSRKEHGCEHAHNFRTAVEVRVAPPEWDAAGPLRRKEKKEDSAADDGDKEKRVLGLHSGWVLKDYVY